MSNFVEFHSCPQCGYDDAIGHPELEWMPILLIIIAIILAVIGIINYAKGDNSLFFFVLTFILSIYPVYYLSMYFSHLQCYRCTAIWNPSQE
jgi:hypothetical protein